MYILLYCDIALSSKSMNVLYISQVRHANPSLNHGWWSQQARAGSEGRWCDHCRQQFQCGEYTHHNCCLHVHHSGVHRSPDSSRIYIYIKRGGFHCCTDPVQPAQQQLPIYRLPAPSPRRHSHSDVKPGSVVEIIRMEDGSEAVMRTYTVGEEKPRKSHSASLSTLLQPMKGMGES